MRKLTNPIVLLSGLLVACQTGSLDGGSSAEASEESGSEEASGDESGSSSQGSESADATSDDGTGETGETDTSTGGESESTGSTGEACDYGNEECPGISCEDILGDGQDQDGVYWVDPNDDGDPFEVYCLMDDYYSGGGWTLILNDVVDGVHMERMPGTVHTDLMSTGASLFEEFTWSNDPQILCRHELGQGDGWVTLAVFDKGLEYPTVAFPVPPTPDLIGNIGEYDHFEPLIENGNGPSNYVGTFFKMGANGSLYLEGDDVQSNALYCGCDSKFVEVDEWVSGMGVPQDWNDFLEERVCSVWVR